MTKRIILADDSAAARKSVENALGSDEFQVITVGDGPSTMEQIEAERPHLVLAHAMLPEIDGYEVCRRVKENSETSHIPVFLLTGTFEPFDINLAKESRYDGFITKPVDGGELRTLALRAIENAVYPAEPEPPVEETFEDTVVIETPEITEPPEPAIVVDEGDGSDAMLDRIFPEDSSSTEPASTDEQHSEEVFSVVEPSEEPDLEPLSPMPAAEETSEEPLETPVAESADEMPTAEEDSDLSWFLRKYEEKQDTSEPENTEETPVEEDSLVPAALEADVPEETVPEPVADPVEPLSTTAPLQVELSDQQIEQISRRVVELLSEQVIRDVAWEAVPEIAERLIQERIREIEAEADASS